MNRCQNHLRERVAVWWSLELIESSHPLTQVVLTGAANE